LFSYLKRDGLLALARTNAPDGVNHASIYRKHASPSRLELVDRLGQGYELDSLVVETLSSED
jgi:hypothetical protein